MAPELVTLEEIRRTAEYLHQTKLIVRTPLVNFQPRCPFFQSSSTTTSPNVYLKLESLQTVGSFKIRGVVNQMRFLPQDVKGCVTMSGGNYGRAFGLNSYFILFSIDLLLNINFCFFLFYKP